MTSMSSCSNNQPSVLFTTNVVAKRCACVKAMVILCASAVAAWSIARRLWLFERRLEF